MLVNFSTSNTFRGKVTVMRRSQMKKNRICKLLDIRYPIIQAPMNWITGAELVAAVSNAGGLGTLGPNAGLETITEDLTLTGERLRKQIRKVKSLTQEPFAVNIAIGVGGERQHSQRCIEVVLAEGVPVAITSEGSPDVYTKVLKDAGLKVIQAISTVRHARKAEEMGVDAVVCEGFEAGGYKGLTELTTFVLVPMVADAVKIPVIAAGGIADSRGMLAALALGADGLYMGTRFMVTAESDAHPKVKMAIVRGEDACTTSIPRDRMLARDLKNLYTEKYMEMKTAGASSEELNEFRSKHSQYHAQVRGDVDGSEICCGQVAGLITGVESAAEVTQNMKNGIHSQLEELKHKLADFL